MCVCWLRIIVFRVIDDKYDVMLSNFCYVGGKIFFVEKIVSFWNVDGDKLLKFKIDIFDVNLIYL